MQLCVRSVPRVWSSCRHVIVTTNMKKSIRAVLDAIEVLLQSRRELAPSQVLHILVLIFSWPHDLASPQRPDMRNSGDEPHYDEKDRESAADAVDGWAAQGATNLDCCEGHAGVGKDELEMC